MTYISVLLNKKTVALVSQTTRSLGGVESDHVVAFPRNLSGKKVASCSDPGKTSSFE